MQENLKYWIILNMIEGVGALRAKRLLEQFGRFEKILTASRNELERFNFRVTANMELNTRSVG